MSGNLCHLFFFFLSWGKFSKDSREHWRMSPGSAVFLPAKTPTVAYCERVPFRVSAPELPSFTRLWVLAHSLFFPLFYPSPCGHARRCPSSVDGCWSAQALTRALLSLGFMFSCVLFGRCLFHQRPLQGGDDCILLFPHCDLSAARGDSLDVLEVWVVALLAHIILSLHSWRPAAHSAVAAEN